MANIKPVWIRCATCGRGGFQSLSPAERVMMDDEVVRGSFGCTDCKENILVDSSGRSVRIDECGSEDFD